MTLSFTQNNTQTCTQKIIDTPSCQIPGISTNFTYFGGNNKDKDAKIQSNKQIEQDEEIVIFKQATQKISQNQKQLLFNDYQKIKSLIVEEQQKGQTAVNDNIEKNQFNEANKTYNNQNSTAQLISKSADVFEILNKIESRQEYSKNDIIEILSQEQLVINEVYQFEIGLDSDQDNKLKLSKLIDFDKLDEKTQNLKEINLQKIQSNCNIVDKGESFDQYPLKSNALRLFIENNPTLNVQGNNNTQDSQNKASPRKDYNKTEQNTSSYFILGQNKIRFTQQRNLLEKIENYFSTPNKQSKIKQKGEIVEEEDIELIKNFKEDQAVKEVVDSDEDDYKQENRYFYFNPTKFCNRCKKQGHYERMCPEESKQTCRLCLGDHLMDSCDKLVCYKCCNIGHRLRDCSYREETQRCYKCRKNGHKVVGCGVITLNQSNLNDRGEEQINNDPKNKLLRQIKCCVCQILGHIYCTTFVEEDLIYDDIYNEEEIQYFKELDIQSLFLSDDIDDIIFKKISQQQKNQKRKKKKGKLQDIDRYSDISQEGESRRRERKKQKKHKIASPSNEEEYHLEKLKNNKKKQIKNQSKSKYVSEENREYRHHRKHHHDSNHSYDKKHSHKHKGQESYHRHHRRHSRERSRDYEKQTYSKRQSHSKKEKREKRENREQKF